MPGKNVFLISGNQGEGKTTRLKEIVLLLKEKGIAAFGFYAEGYWQHAVRNRFDLVDLRSGSKRMLCTDKVQPGFIVQGRFYFDPDTIQWGNSLLEKGAEINGQIAVIDEVGRFELHHQIWAAVLENLLAKDIPLLLVVRKNFIAEIKQKFNLGDARVFMPDISAAEAANQIQAVLCQK